MSRSRVGKAVSMNRPWFGWAESVGQFAESGGWFYAIVL